MPFPANCPSLLESVHSLDWGQNLNKKEGNKMEQRVRCFELRNGQGKVICGLYIFDREPDPENKPPAPETRKPETKKTDSKKSAATGEKPPNKGEEKAPAATNPAPINGDLMTDAQKRYLFRLLADQGMEGDSAYQYLKDHFQVNSLKEITKLEASRVIDRLVTEAQGGGDERPPF